MSASGPPPSTSAAKVDQIAPDTTHALVEAMGDEGDRVAPRLARGCRCFGVFDGGELVAYGWVSQQPEWIGELGLELTPAGGEAYVWNCVTLPAHRRKGNYRALLAGIVADARAEGFARLWIGSVEDPAEKADADAGFEPVLHVTVTRRGRFRRLHAEPAPGANPELVDAARSRLGLRSWTAYGPVLARMH